MEKDGERMFGKYRLRKEVERNALCLVLKTGLGPEAPTN
jgi:hypothetical protein